MADSSRKMSPIFPPESPSSSPPDPGLSLSSDSAMRFGERAVSAAGAAVLSAILVNPLDVAKTRLQAQAAGVPYHLTKNCIGEHIASRNANFMFSDIRCSPSSACNCLLTAEPASLRESFRYKGTFDVLFKVARQEGYARLWRGTNASLALAIPTVGIYLPCYDIFRNWIEELANKNSSHLAPYAPLFAGSAARSLACIVCSPIELARTRMQAFREIQTGQKPSGVWKTLLGVLSPVRSSKYPLNFGGYTVLWTGVGSQLARDVPFSAICWSILEPIRRSLLGLIVEEGSPVAIFGANFTAGFVASSLAAAATCPLDVVKTRRQIEDPVRARNSNTWRILSDVWRSGGMKGLFTGVGPRVGRAGPSTGIVVSFYEVVKYALHQRHNSSLEE